MNKQLLLGFLMVGSCAVAQAWLTGHQIKVENGLTSVVKVKDPTGGGNLILFEIKPGETKVVGEIKRSELGLGNKHVEKKFLLDLPGVNDVIIAAKHGPKLSFAANAPGSTLTWAPVSRGPLNLKTNNLDSPSFFDVGGGYTVKVTWKIEQLYPDLIFKIERK